MQTVCRLVSTYVFKFSHDIKVNSLIRQMGKFVK